MATRSSDAFDLCELKVELDSVPLEVDSFNPPGAGEWDKGGAAIGTRFRPRDRRTQTKRPGEFTLAVKVTHGEGVLLIPKLFTGDTAVQSGGFWDGYTKHSPDTDPADSANAFTVRTNYEHASGQLKTQGDCYFNGLQVEFSENAPIVFTPQLVQTGDDGTAADTISDADGSSQAVFSDCSIQIDDDDWSPEGMRIEISNAINFQNLNNLRAIATGAGEFMAKGSVTLNMNTDMWSYLMSKADTNTGATLSVKAEHTSGVGFGFGFGDISLLGPWPTLSGSGPVRHELSWEAAGAIATMASGYVKAS